MGGLVREALTEQRPGLSMDRTVETGLPADVPARVGNRALGGSNHVLDPEVLDDDEVEVPYQLGRGLLDPVPPAVRLFGCQPGHAPPGVCPSVGALLLSGELTRQPGLPLGLTGRAQGRNPKVDPIGGGDGGMAPSIPTSDGVHLWIPTLRSAGEAQRKPRLPRQLSRQQKGSNRRAYTRRCMARLAAKEADRRRNWIEKTTTQLVRDFDLIVIENLRVKNMVRSANGTVANPGRNVRQKSGLNRSIYAQSWALFRQRLTDKATHATDLVELVSVNPAYTSQRCSDCGYAAKDNPESQAIFRCRACGFTSNADVNAAINILAAGGQPVTGRRGTSHAPPIGVDQAQRPDEASTTRKPLAA